jgi:N-acetylglucosaminyldiphosphoundecaprenol N-acetyl-beta-D-mannosaminyltransferase
MRDNNSIEVLGVQMFNKDLDTFLRHVLEVLSEENPRSNRCVSATGAHGIVYAKKNSSFKGLLNSFYANLPDGMPGVWVGRRKGAAGMKRCYGPEVFAKLMKRSASTEAKHFLCGGKEGVAEKLEKACAVKFGNTKIVGTYCPPFKKVSEYDYEGIAKEINESGADIVWIGISTPKQEKFAKRLSEYTDVHFLITVGAAFDFHIGELRQAPSWMQKAGLEWFFRLMVEPRRLYRRYLEIVPTFFFHGIKDVYKHRVSRHNKAVK